MSKKFLLRAAIIALDKYSQNRRFHGFRRTLAREGVALVETRSIALDFHLLDFPSPQPRSGSDGLVDRKAARKLAVFLRNQIPNRYLD